MTRHRKTDAHIATVRVSVPIDPMDVLTITTAHMAINDIRTYLPPGSTVEVLNSRFGRVDAPTPTPEQYGKPQVSADDLKLMPAMGATQMDIESALASVAHQVTAGAMPDPLDPPESLRRVPRRDPYNGATPMDPSGDGSYRGPDGAR